MHRARGRLRSTRLVLALACAGMPSPSAVPAGANAALSIAPIERSWFPLSPPTGFAIEAPPPFARRVAALDPDAAAWPALLADASTDDPVPACRLAVLLEDCRLAQQVEAMIDTELSMAAREGRAPESAAPEILALDASGAAAQAACGAAPAELLAHEWSYLLRAALAGHEPSVHRFVTDLPVDPAWPGEARAARAAWREHAPRILAALVQRGSPESLMLAYRAAQGFAILGDEPLQPRDARAAARLGSALAIVHDDDPALAVELAALAVELSPAQYRQSRKEGERVAETFLSPLHAVHLTGGDECDAGWPGMQPSWAAYGYQSGR